jgi:ketosteroid isomerase-like protein
MGTSADVLEIRDVLDRYAAGIDRRDFELVRSCFAPEVRADYGRGGSWTEREPFVTWLDEIHRDVGPTMHRITNHQVHVDGDTASTTSYFDALLQVEHQGHDLLHVVGTYTDELRRDGGGWRITSRRTTNFLWRREDGAVR